MPALALWWAYIRTGSIGAWAVALKKDWSEVGQHHVQTPTPRCTKAKARGFGRVPSTLRPLEVLEMKVLL